MGNESNKTSGNIVEVKAHTRDGYDVVAHTRSAPGSGGGEEASEEKKEQCLKDLSTREILEKIWNGEFPVKRTDGKKGERYIKWNEDIRDFEEVKPQMTKMPAKSDYFELPSDCKEPKHELDMFSRGLDIDNRLLDHARLNHTGYSLVSTCNNRRQFINSQELDKTKDDKIVSRESYSPAQTYSVNGKLITWHNNLPDDQKDNYKDNSDYLISKRATTRKIANGDKAVEAYNLMGFENQLVNAIPKEQKPKYRWISDNCNTSTQWKKDNHFPEVKGKSVTDVLGKWVWGDGGKPNETYQIINVARKALVSNNLNIDFSKITNIHWSDINKFGGEMLRFSDDRRNYIIYKDPNHPDKYRVLIQTRWI